MIPDENPEDRGVACYILMQKYEFSHYGFLRGLQVVPEVANAAYIQISVF